jgi:hypothetical protein
VVVGIYIVWVFGATRILIGGKIFLSREARKTAPSPAAYPSHEREKKIKHIYCYGRTREQRLVQHVKVKIHHSRAKWRTHVTATRMHIPCMGGASFLYLKPSFRDGAKSRASRHNLCGLSIILGRQSAHPPGIGYPSAKQEQTAQKKKEYY